MLSLPLSYLTLRVVPFVAAVTFILSCKSRVLTVFPPKTLAKHAHSLDCELLFDVGYVLFPVLAL